MPLKVSIKYFDTGNNSTLNDVFCNITRICDSDSISDSVLMTSGKQGKPCKILYVNTNLIQSMLIEGN